MIQNHASVYMVSTSSSPVLGTVMGDKMIADETDVLFWKVRFLILLKAVAVIEVLQIHGGWSWNFAPPSCMVVMTWPCNKDRNEHIEVSLYLLLLNWSKIRRTPMNGLSARCRGCFLHNKHKLWTSMPSAEFETSIPKMKPPQTNVVDRASNGVGPLSHVDLCVMLLKKSSSFKIYKKPLQPRSKYTATFRSWENHNKVYGNFQSLGFSAWQSVIFRH